MIFAVTQSERLDFVETCFQIETVDYNNYFNALSINLKELNLSTQLIKLKQGGNKI